MLQGHSRMPFRAFCLWGVIINILKSDIFVIGYKTIFLLVSTTKEHTKRTEISVFRVFRVHFFLMMLWFQPILSLFVFFEY